MELSQEELEAAKAYMRVDGDEDNAVVTQCVIAARAYLTGAGVSLPAPDTQRRSLYDLVCHVLALEAYDRRVMTITGTIVANNPVMRQMLNQLKLTEPPVSKLGTGAGDGEEG